MKNRFDDAIAPAVPHVADPGDEVGAINDILGFHIRLAHGACLRHFTETFTDLDLTQKQVSVLWLVDDHPGIAQTDLAQRLRMDRATTMAIINRLQAKHYLKRDRSPTDGRKQALLPGTRIEQLWADHSPFFSRPVTLARMLIDAIPGDTSGKRVVA